MATSFVVSALRRKYGQLKGELRYIPPPDTAPLILAINQVGCVLRMFSPGENLTAIRPIRPYRQDRRSWSRAALDILRSEGRPMAARELAKRVMEARGLAPDPGAIISAECSLHAVLERLEGHGVIREAGEPKRWSIDSGQDQRATDSTTQPNRARSG